MSDDASNESDQAARPGQDRAAPAPGGYPPGAPVQPSAEADWPAPAGSDESPEHSGEAEPEHAEHTEPDPRTRDELLAALAEAEQARDEQDDQLRRSQAEFENTRKRLNKERMEAHERGAEALAANMLGVLDNLRFAREAASASTDDQLAKGVEMVATELVEVLANAGLEEIGGLGETFDPNVQEAMTHEQAEESVDEPVVTEVMRPGYRFNGRVLRPASVKVAS
jgi:molecular chaperone GrpE